MKLRLQIGGCLLALGISAGLALPCAAQKPRDNDRPPQQQRKQVQRQEHRQDRPASTPRPRGERTYTPSPPARNPETNRPRAASVNSLAGSNRPPNATARPRELSPEEGQRLQQNQRRFNQLTSPQKDDMRRRAEVWQRMTPEQQTHVKKRRLTVDSRRFRTVAGSTSHKISQSHYILHNFQAAHVALQVRRRSVDNTSLLAAS
jgi:hypothetical protein